MKKQTTTNSADKKVRLAIVAALAFTSLILAVCEPTHGGMLTTLVATRTLSVLSGLACWRLAVRWGEKGMLPDINDNSDRME